MELKGKKINFLGDSITEAHGTSNVTHSFWNVMARESGVISRGYGIGGTRIARQKNASAESKWDRDFIARVDEMDPDADVVVVFGGTNDFGHGDAPFGRMSDRTEYTFYGAMHLLCQKLIARYPAARIVFMTPLHRLSEDVTTNEIGLLLGADLAGYCDAIKEVCRYYSLPVLDLFAVSGIQPKVPVIQEMYMPDGLHPNDMGHRRIADLLTAFLKGI